jgi:hypothetical protein
MEDVTGQSSNRSRELPLQPLNLELVLDSRLRPALRGEKLKRAQPLYWQYPFGVGLRDGTRAASVVSLK